MSLGQLLDRSSPASSRSSFDEQRIFIRDQSNPIMNYGTFDLDKFKAFGRHSNRESSSPDRDMERVAESCHIDWASTKFVKSLSTQITAPKTPAAVPRTPPAQRGRTGVELRDLPGGPLFTARNDDEREYRRYGNRRGDRRIRA